MFKSRLFLFCLIVCCFFFFLHWHKTYQVNHSIEATVVFFRYTEFLQLKCTKAIIFHFCNDFSEHLCAKNCFCTFAHQFNLVTQCLISAEYFGSETLCHLPHEWLIVCYYSVLLSNSILGGFLSSSKTYFFYIACKATEQEPIIMRSPTELINIVLDTRF